MILPGRIVLARRIVQGLLSSKDQAQPCGIDLSLKRLMRWTSEGVIDFDNQRRKTAETAEIPFDTFQKLHVDSGSYLIEFNETVDTPLDVMGEIFVRSSLFRSGALVTAGVMDSGYAGAIGTWVSVLMGSDD